MVEWQALLEPASVTSVDREREPTRHQIAVLIVTLGRHLLVERRSVRNADWAGSRARSRRVAAAAMLALSRRQIVLLACRAKLESIVERLLQNARIVIPPKDT